MADKKARKKPDCSMCGTCCLKLGLEIYMTPGDYRRWKHQGRDDILRYAYVIPKSGGRGYLWFDPKIKLELDRCPFLTEAGPGKYACAIQETKPRICQRFWCEWTYGAGEKGAPFKVDEGWSQKARQLGYGKSEHNNSLPLTKYGDESGIAPSLCSGKSEGASAPSDIKISPFP